MILCLDVGNSQIYGGVYHQDKLLLRFRHDTKQGSTSDQIGIFLKSVLRENEMDHKQIKQIAICSVVPSMDYSLRAACKKYFTIEPFILKTNIKTDLIIKTKNPHEVGADLVAAAIAAINFYENSNIIVVDFGTATTYSIISSKKEYLGAIFLPGFRLAMTSLGNAAKLFPVEILKPQSILGRSTAESIQSGLYYSQLGTLKEIIAQIEIEIFPKQKPLVVATGGFAHLFTNEELITAIVPDLVLDGLKIALLKNN